MICAGVDAGSRALKIVLMDADSLAVVASGTRDQGVEQGDLAQQLFDELLRSMGLDRGGVSRVVATGYGRYAVEFAHTTITEITCHATGVRRLVPGARTIIDIGGQDSKLIRLDPNGTVRDFAMNDRCAAGTGCFLEVVARRLGRTLQELGAAPPVEAKAATISSMCVVFAETEIIGLLAAGGNPDSIVAGVQAAIAQRVASMAGRSIEPPAVFTGGVALIPGMRGALESALKQPIGVAPDPQMTGALGAAVLACRQGNGRG